MVIVAPSSAVTAEIVRGGWGGGGVCGLSSGVDCPQSAAGTEHNESTAGADASVEALKLYANLNLLLLALVACIVQKMEND